ncbi:MAG: S41 family peptidase, partial [Planctomycetota bacterium]
PVGGRETRVTATDRAQTLGDFSGDGQRLLFHSSREAGMYRSSRLFQVAVEGGPVERLTDAFGYDPRSGVDGRVFFRRGRELETRPRYQGPATPTLWSLEGDSATQLTEMPGSEHDGHPLPDGGMLFIAGESGSNQIWRRDGQGRDARLTDFRPADGEPTIGHGVRDLRVSSNGAHAVFCVWDRLFRLDLGQPGAEPVEIEVRLSADDASAERRSLDLSREVDEAVLSPDGRTVAIAARGEILIRATKEGRPTRRVTQGAARDGDLAWSPDGSRLYYATDEATGFRSIWFAEVDLTRADIEPVDESTEDVVDDAEAAAESEGETEADVEGEATAEADGDDAESEEESRDESDDAPKHGERWADALTFRTERLVSEPGMDLWGPRPSPDGQSLLFHRERGDLMLHSLESGETRAVLRGWDEPQVQWAADSRHIVYAVADLDFNTDVWIGDVGPADATEWSFEPVNVTRHPDNDVSPQLSADGKVLVFLSERAGENWSWDVWRVHLDKGLDGLTDYDLTEHFEEAAETLSKRKSPALGGDAVELFEFDLEDAWLRATRLTDLPGSESDLNLSPAGDTVFFTGTVGEDTALWSVDHLGEDREQIASGSPDGVALTPDGKWIGYVDGGRAKRVKSGGGKVETLGIDARAEIDVAAEQRQKFLEAARVMELDFYHPTLKGLDWTALTASYARLAEGTATSAEFNRVGNMLLGELDGSHLGMYGGEAFSAPDTATGYLGVDTRGVEGGFQVAEVIDGGPAAQVTSRLHVGDVIFEVAGASVADENGQVAHDLHTMLAGTRGGEVLIGVRDASGDERLVLIEPISWGAENTLRYGHGTRLRREAVERLSDGRLGYLHIRGMSARYVRDFERDLYAAAHGKDGLLIDVRDNGGGSTTDILLASLTAPNHAFTVPRGADFDSTPRDAYPRDRRLIYGYSRPIAVLINENSFSNAEIFAHSIKTIGRGLLVGTQTFGGVISTGSARLIDDTLVRRPFRGWYLPDGTDMEHNGAEPDVPVEQTPADDIAGVDRQLEAAVESLLKSIDAGR